MEPIFATERLEKILPVVRAFVLEELVPPKKEHLTRLPGNYTRKEIVARYAAKSGEGTV